VYTGIGTGLILEDMTGSIYTGSISWTHSGQILEDITDSGSELSQPRLVLEYITQLFHDSIQIISDFVALQITALRGYFDEIFARKITADEMVTQTLCVADTSGAKTCITKSQLDAMILGLSHTGTTSTPSAPVAPIMDAVVPVSPSSEPTDPATTNTT
jgi:hypothetical protein